MKNMEQNMDNGKWIMKIYNEEWIMENNLWKMDNGKWKMNNGK